VQRLLTVFTFLPFLAYLPEQKIIPVEKKAWRKYEAIRNVNYVGTGSLESTHWRVIIKY
jgi:hypothetical protein